VAHISLILGNVELMSYNGVILRDRPVLGCESKDPLFSRSQPDLLK